MGRDFHHRGTDDERQDPGQRRQSSNQKAGNQGNDLKGELVSGCQHLYYPKRGDQSRHYLILDIHCPGEETNLRVIDESWSLFQEAYDACVALNRNLIFIHGYRHGDSWKNAAIRFFGNENVSPYRNNPGVSVVKIDPELLGPSL